MKRTLIAIAKRGTKATISHWWSVKRTDRRKPRRCKHNLPLSLEKFLDSYLIQGKSWRSFLISEGKPGKSKPILSLALSCPYVYQPLSLRRALLSDGNPLVRAPISSSWYSLTWKFPAFKCNLGRGRFAAYSRSIGSFQTTNSTMQVWQWIVIGLMRVITVIGVIGMKSA